jgi:hypothetical protein
MSDPAVAAQRQQQRQQGLIAGLVTLPFRFFGVLCGALLLCILIECVGMHFFWPDQGWRHAQGMLHYELDQLSTHFTRSALVQEPGRTAHRLVEQGYDWLFVKSGLLDWIRDASAQASAGSHRPTKDFRYYLGLGLRERGELPDRGGLHDAGLPRAAAGAVPDPAAVPDGRLRRAGGRPGAPGHPPLRRGTRIGVHLSPRQGQPDPAGRAAVGDLPGTAGQREPAADPAAQRALLGVAVCIAAATFKKYL